jgi:hypothetical protein
MNIKNEANRVCVELITGESDATAHVWKASIEVICVDKMLSMNLTHKLCSHVHLKSVSQR